MSLFWAHLTGYFLKQPFQIALIGPNLSLLCGKDSPTLIHKLNLTWNWVSAIFSMKSPFSNLKFEARGNANVGSNPTQMQEKKKRKKGSNYFSKIKMSVWNSQPHITKDIKIPSLFLKPHDHVTIFAEQKPHWIFCQRIFQRSQVFYKVGIFCHITESNEAMFTFAVW